MKAGCKTIDNIARHDPYLKGRIGADSELHTHNRKLEYHPNVHMIVPAGVVNETRRHRRHKAEKNLFPALNLPKVCRAENLHGIKALGLKAQEILLEEWVVTARWLGEGIGIDLPQALPLSWSYL